MLDRDTYARWPDLLVLVRHAESERNVAKRGRPFFDDVAAAAPFRGRADKETALTEAGQRMARALGEELRERFSAFDAVIDSGYRRTVETADLALEAWPAVARAAARSSNVLLRERDAGYAVNMTTTEAEAAFPWLQDYWKAEGPFYARPPGGESLADVARRVEVFLYRELASLAGRRALLVSHIGTIQMLRMLLERWPPEDVPQRLAQQPIGNGAIVAYAFDTGEPRLLTNR